MLLNKRKYSQGRENNKPKWRSKRPERLWRKKANRTATPRPSRLPRRWTKWPRAKRPTSGSQIQTSTTWTSGRIKQKSQIKRKNMKRTKLRRSKLKKSRPQRPNLQKKDVLSLKKKARLRSSPNQRTTNQLIDLLRPRKKQKHRLKKTRRLNQKNLNPQSKTQRKPKQLLQQNLKSLKPSLNLQKHQILTLTQAMRKPKRRNLHKRRPPPNFNWTLMTWNGMMTMVKKAKRKERKVANSSSSNSKHRIKEALNLSKQSSNLHRRLQQLRQLRTMSKSRISPKRNSKRAKSRKNEAIWTTRKSNTSATCAVKCSQRATKSCNTSNWPVMPCASELHTQILT